MNWPWRGNRVLGPGLPTDNRDIKPRRPLSQTSRAGHPGVRPQGKLGASKKSAAPTPRPALQGPQGPGAPVLRPGICGGGSVSPGGQLARKGRGRGREGCPPSPGGQRAVSKCPSGTPPRPSHSPDAQEEPEPREGPVPVGLPSSPCSLAPSLSPPWPHSFVPPSAGALRASQLGSLSLASVSFSV